MQLLIMLTHFLAHFFYYLLPQTHGAHRGQSLKATRNFSVSDWSKNFEVVFQDEEGSYPRVSSIPSYPSLA